MLWKMIIVESSITTTFIKHKHRNTGTSALIHPVSLKKTVSLKPSLGLSVEIWSRFFRLVCFNWVHKSLPASF